MKHALQVYEGWKGAWPGHYPRDYTVIAVYRDGGKRFTMDNGKKDRPRRIRGPYNAMEDLPGKIFKIDDKFINLTPDSLTPQPSSLKT